MDIQSVNKKTIDEIVQYAIDKIEDIKPDCHGADLHNELFNTDYYIIGRYDAEQWLIAHDGIFWSIDQIKEYEQENFGEVNTDLSEPEHVVNMFVYMVGEEILIQSNALNEAWDRRLAEEDRKAIIEDLKGLL